MPLGCIGHWYSDLLYLAPVGVMVGLVGVDKVKHRLKGPRDGRRTPRGGPPRRPPAGARRPHSHKGDAVPSARR
jgi:hypothetical protein